MLWFSFLRKDTEECFLLIPCSTKHKIENSEINAVYFYHSFTNTNLHRCFTAFSDILMQKEWHFHFKKWDIKTSWLRLRMAEITFLRSWNFQIFGGGCLQTPPYKVAALPFHWTPYAKILDLPQKTQGLSWTKIPVIFHHINTYDLL